jgi:hypothetical protein
MSLLPTSFVVLSVNEEGLVSEVNDAFKLQLLSVLMPRYEKDMDNEVLPYSCSGFTLFEVEGNGDDHNNFELLFCW